jgi:hypothetical protein
MKEAGIRLMKALTAGIILANLKTSILYSGHCR